MALLGPPPGRRGQGGQGGPTPRRLWWRCPLHDDRNPSFLVELGKPWWKCFGCGARGDAPGLIMKLKGVRFPEAVRIAAELSGMPEHTRGVFGSGLGACATRAETALTAGSALSLVDESAQRLWTPEGAGALAYLHRRGLSDETIREARLGWCPGASIPTREGDRCYRASGVVIPWFDAGTHPQGAGTHPQGAGPHPQGGEHLVLVKIRQAEGSRPKYVEAFRDGDRAGPCLFPGRSIVRSGRPLVIVEGEFDALLMGQELAAGPCAVLGPREAESPAVVTLGSASNSVRPGPGLLATLLEASPWFLATDADPAGDLVIDGWPRRVRHVRPPAPWKDWTEAFQGGLDLRAWWEEVFTRSGSR